MNETSHSIYFSSFYSTARKWCSDQASQGNFVTIEDFCNHYGICKRCKGVGCETCGKPRIPLHATQMRKTKKQKRDKKKRDLARKMLDRYTIRKRYG